MNCLTGKRACAILERNTAEGQVPLYHQLLEVPGHPGGGVLDGGPQGYIHILIPRTCERAYVEIASVQLRFHCIRLGPIFRSQCPDKERLRDKLTVGEAEGRWPEVERSRTN